MSFLECYVCKVPYDEDGHRPRNAPCRHDICSSCARALIKDRIFECPKCKEKHKVDNVEDLHVNYGLTEVIQAFKSGSTILAKETGASGSAATNDDVCRDHGKVISHWCSNCQLWICLECTESHTSSVGCSTTTSTKAMGSLKEKSIKDIKPILEVFDADTDYVSSKIQVHMDKSKEHLEMARKHDEEVKKLQLVLDQGNVHKAKLEESQQKLSKATSPHAVSDNIKEITQKKQTLRTWSVKNLGTDTPLGLSKALKEGKDVYAAMELNKEPLYSKLSDHGERMCVHSFQKKAISADTICMPFPVVQKLIPDDASLMFLEFTVGSTVKGRVTVRLDVRLPRIREYMLSLATGQQGPALSTVVVNSHAADYMYASSLPQFKDTHVTPETGSTTVKQGDVCAVFGPGYLDALLFYVASPPATRDLSGWVVIGSVEDRLHIVLDCHSKYKSNGGVNISDSGLIIE